MNAFVVASLAGVGAMAAAIALSRSTSAVSARCGTRVVGQGRWLDVLIRIATPIARRMEGHIPPTIGHRLARQLRHAGFEEESCRPADWVAASIVVWIVVAVTVCGFARSGIWAVCGATLGAAWLQQWLREQVSVRSAAVHRELPSAIDTLIVAVEAGCSLGVAFRLCANQCPAGIVQREMSRVVQGIRAGESQPQALARMVDRLNVPAVATFAASVQHAAQTGASLAPLLRMQVTQRTEERFARAEKLAMEAPVKMLLPLIVCLFPCAFLVLGFPIAMRLFQWH